MQLPSRHQIPQAAQEVVRQTNIAFQSLANGAHISKSTGAPSSPNNNSRDSSTEASSFHTAPSAPKRTFSEPSADPSSRSSKPNFNQTAPAAGSSSAATVGFSSASAEPISFSSPSNSTPIPMSYSEIPAQSSNSSSAAIDTTSTSTFRANEASGFVQERRATRRPLVPASSPEHVGRRRPATSRERRVPSHPVERAAGFGSLAIGMVAGAATESLRRLVSGQELSKRCALSL